MDNIKVLVLSSLYPNQRNPNLGIFIHNQVKHLREAGCHIKVISPVPLAFKVLWFNPKWKSYGQIPERALIDEIEVFYPRYVQVPGAWFHGISCYTMYLGVQKILESINNNFHPDILHAHRATPEGCAGLLIKKKYNIPLVCSLRGSDINIFPYRDKPTMFLTKKVILNADQLVSVSHALKAIAESISKPKKSIKVVYNGCDLADFTYNKKERQRRRAELGISEEDRAIIFIGNLFKNKGIYDLITAFIKMSSTYQSLNLILLGNGPEYSTIKNIISSSSHVGKKIHLLGNKPHNEVSHWLSAADIFVLPTYNEGLPNAVLEAMVCGLPVIATRVGGIPEVVEEGKNGILINKKDINSLINAIKYLLNNEILAHNMGIQGRQLFKDKFSWERNAENMIKIYREAVGAEN